jgi:hypothetical protein
MLRSLNNFSEERAERGENKHRVNPIIALYILAHTHTHKNACK